MLARPSVPRRTQAIPGLTSELSSQSQGRPKIGLAPPGGGSSRQGEPGVVLTGLGWGEPLDRARHRPAVEIKGATYTELHVRQDADGTWHAQCVVDV